MKEPKALVARWGQLKTERAPLDAIDRQIAKYIRPSRQEMMQHYGDVVGVRAPVSDAYITDDTSFLAADNYTGSVFGFLSNPATSWAKLRTNDDDLNQFHSAKEWFDIVNDRLMKSFSPARSNFYTEVPEVYGDTPAFGRGILYNEFIPEEGFFADLAIAPSLIWIETDTFGRVIAVYRLVNWTPDQAVAKFGKDALSDKMQQKVDKPQQPYHPFLHVVYVNDDYQPEKRLERLKGRPLIDVYIEVDQQHQVQEDGRWDLPYQVPRWAGSGKYGYGLGARNLPAAKTANAIDRALLEATEHNARPSILDHSELTTEGLNLTPRGVSYGTINSRGQRLVDFISPNGSIPITHDAVEARKQAIRDAWMFSMLNMQGRTGVNIEETLQNQEDKMRQMGPGLARQQIELLSPLVKRRYDELTRRGALPEPPEELREQELEVEYVSPMAVAMVAAEARGTLQLVNATEQLAQINPAARDLLDVDEAFHTIHRGVSAPGKVAHSPEEVARLRQERAEARQAKEALVQGTAGADIANKLGIKVPANGEATNAA